MMLGVRVSVGCGQMEDQLKIEGTPAATDQTSTRTNAYKIDVHQQERGSKRSNNNKPR